MPATAVTRTRGWRRGTARLAGAALCCLCAGGAHAAASADAQTRGALLQVTGAWADVAQAGGGLARIALPAPAAHAWWQANAQMLGLLHDLRRGRAFWREAESIAAAHGWAVARDDAAVQRARLELEAGALDAARDAAAEALLRATARHDDATAYEADMVMANSLRLAGNVADAQIRAAAAATAAKALGDNGGQSRALSLLAVLAKNKGDYLQGLQYDIEALRQGEPALDVQTQAITLSKLGKLYEQIEDNTQALEYQARALKLAEGQVGAETRAHILVSYANVLNDIQPGEHAQALGYAERALATARAMGNRTLQVDAGLQVARAAFNGDDLDAAAPAFAEALATALAIGQRASVAHVLLRQGELFERQGHLREAIANSNEAIALYKESDNLPRLIKSDAILERQLRASGDAAGATEARLNRFELRDRVLGASAMRGLAELEAKTLQDSQRQQIELLQRQRELDGLRLDHESLQRWMMLGLALVAGAGALLLLWRVRASLRVNRLLHDKNHEILAQQQALETSNGELRRSAERLFTAATTDALTGCCSRAHGFDLLREGIASAAAGSTPLAVLLIDVDHFKDINDRHGHLLGDRALRAVAGLLREALGGAELVRFGGEEFLALLPGTDADQAMALGETLRAAIERGSARREPHLALTASIGVCTLADIDKRDLETLLGAADQALYAAKRAGRNRVCRHVGLAAVRSSA